MPFFYHFRKSRKSKQKPKQRCQTRNSEIWNRSLIYISYEMVFACMFSAAISYFIHRKTNKIPPKSKKSLGCFVWSGAISSFYLWSNEWFFGLEWMICATDDSAWNYHHHVKPEPWISELNPKRGAPSFWSSQDRQFFSFLREKKSPPTPTTVISIEWHQHKSQQKEGKIVKNRINVWIIHESDSKSDAYVFLLWISYETKQWTMYTQKVSIVRCK